VFLGLYNKESIEPNPNEVEDYQWIDFELLLEDMKSNKEKYTVWFQRIIGKIKTDQIDIFEVY